jgi:Flp pilus assembly protein TadD
MWRSCSRAAFSCAGNHIHITTQLVDAGTGFQLWSRRFDTPETGLLSVEGQIAEPVVTSAKGVLLDGDMARLRLGGTANAQAFDADLSGLVAMNAVNGDGDREAITAFGAAVAADPEFAEAYAHRAQAETYLAVNGGTKDSAESVALLAAAQRDAEQAVRLAPNLAAAHAALGSVLRFQLTDLGRAETKYRRAAEIAPQDATILMNEALFQAELGHAALALAAARHALILDPLQPTNYRFLAEILLDAGLFDDAQTQLRHASNLQPLDANQDQIALALVQLAKYDMHGASAHVVGAGISTTSHALPKPNMQSATRPARRRRWPRRAPRSATRRPMSMLVFMHRGVGRKTPSIGCGAPTSCVTLGLFI